MSERPLECAHCKRPLYYLYKEIASGTLVCTEMCKECPILEERLHGPPSSERPEREERETGLCCNQCRTSLQEVKTGGLLGCPCCYAVFEDLLVAELIQAKEIPPALEKQCLLKRSHPLHFGKGPSQGESAPSAERLVALNEALNEALKRENYEQAAWLRDQIHALRERDVEGQ